LSVVPPGNSWSLCERDRISALHIIAIHALWRGKRCFSSVNYWLVTTLHLDEPISRPPCVAPAIYPISEDLVLTARPSYRLRTQNSYRKERRYNFVLNLETRNFVSQTLNKIPNMCDFRIPPRNRWDLPSSGLLCVYCCLTFFRCRTAG